MYTTNNLRFGIASMITLAALVSPLAAGPASAQTTASSRSIAVTCPEGEVPPAGFTDVSAENVHSRAIDCLRHRGLTAGVGRNLYLPAGTVDRGQTAAFVARLLRNAGVELPAEPVDAFADDEGSVHEADINALASVGLVRGTHTNAYDPHGEVTRGQMITLLVAAVEHTLDLVLTTEGDHFEDDNGSVHEVSINKAGAAGVVTGFDDGTYRVNGEVARDQMASFALRALDLIVSRPGWERAVDLIEECRVKSALQTHSLSVTLSLKDGGTHTTTEPYRDAVFDEIAKADHCPPLESIAIE